jgi:hypothetical protein
MTVGKASALAAGFVGAVALGVAIGPWVTGRTITEQAIVAQPAVQVATPDSSKERPAPARTRRAPAAGDATATGETRAAARSTAPAAAAIPASQPELHQRLKKVLNRGADMSMAAEGFKSAEQFAMVAHAARNTEVPFMLLKHRILNEGRTLEQAILDSRPVADAKAEVARARDEARADLAAISG